MCFLKRKKMKAENIVTNSNNLNIDFDKILEIYKSGSEEVKEKIKDIVMDKKIAQDIYWFFPTIVFRMMYPQITYLPKGKYIVSNINSKSQKEYKFSSNNTFIECERFLKKVFYSLDKNTLFKIISHGGDLQAVNQATENGSRLADLYLLTMFISHEKE